MTATMPSVVVDASALLETLSPQRDPELVRRLALANATAPEIIDLEIVHVLRRRARRDPSVTTIIERDVALLADASIIRVSHRGLIRRGWELRHSSTAYDAAYVALAEELDVPLITCDAKLGDSNGHRAKIETYSSAS